MMGELERRVKGALGEVEHNSAARKRKLRFGDLGRDAAVPAFGISSHVHLLYMLGRARPFARCVAGLHSLFS
jgi:hypothetical protein